MKYPLFCALAFLFMTTSHRVNSQITFSPGDTMLHYNLIHERNVFQKLVWLDSNGVVKRTAILNLVTRIDTVHHTVTYLQIRNDGKIDSSVSSYPGLEPIYLSTVGKQFRETYDYRQKGVIAVHTEKDGQVTYDGKERVAPRFFESYLTDLVMTTLPLETMKPLEFFFYNTNAKQVSAYVITNINQDVFLGFGGNNIPVYVLSVRAGKNEFLLYMDIKSHQTLKTVFVAEDGSSFVKELL